MTRTLKMADKPHRLEKPLSELMRNHRLRIDGVASGSITLDEQELQDMTKTVRTIEELFAEQERQEMPTLTASDWLGRAELNIGDLRRLVARGQIDKLTLQRSIEAAMTQLVAARAAAGRAG